MNLMIIGDKVLDVAQSIHQHRRSYYLIEVTGNLNDVKLKSFLKYENVILLVNPNKIFKWKINSVIDYCERHKIGVTLISNSLEGESMKEEMLYYTIARHFPDTTTIWYRNQENIGYDEMVERSVAVLDYTL